MGQVVSVIIEEMLSTVNAALHIMNHVGMALGKHHHYRRMNNTFLEAAQFMNIYPVW